MTEVAAASRRFWELCHFAPNPRVSLKTNGMRCSCAFGVNRCGLRSTLHSDIVFEVNLLLQNLPQSLSPQRETIARCLEAMNRVMSVRKVFLFGSHARGDSRPDSDVDLCIVADGATHQLAAAQLFRREMRPIPAKPSFTLVPITPERLSEKQGVGDHFFSNCSERRSPACRKRLIPPIPHIGSISRSPTWTW